MAELIPSISVVMSVYNNAPFLREAMESILHQTFTDFEFLIMDDGSTDRSLAMLHEYAAQDARVVVFSRDNQGIARSLNELIATAKGEFIARMDADDIALPDRFANQVDFLRRHPKVLCVGGALDWIDAKGRFLGHCAMPESDAEIQNLLIGGISMLHHPTAMMRRSALATVGGYNESMVASSDLDLWLRLGDVGQLANISQTVLQYRLHPSSVTQAKQRQQAQDALAACQRAWKRRGIQGTFIRQPADHLNQLTFWLKCGWQNFIAGRRDAARRCGIQAIAIQPTNWEAWRLLACALIKPIPKSQVNTQKQVV